MAWVTACCGLASRRAKMARAAKLLRNTVDGDAECGERMSVMWRVGM